MAYARPGAEGALVSFPESYDNFIGGKWTPPVHGEYFDDISPVDGKPFVTVARSTAAGIDPAVSAAHAGAPVWGRTSVTERSNILLAIAARTAEHLEELAVAETWENGKPVRETLAADLPLAIDHFRYFAGAVPARGDARLRAVSAGT